MKNGQKVTTAAMWRTRRTELIEVFEREVYGRRPANIPKVSWQVVNTSRETNGSVATVTRQLLGRVDNSAYPAISVNIQAILTLPANVRERVPVIIQFGGGAFDLPANVSTSANPCQLPGAGRGAPPPAPPAAAGAPQELTWQQQILSRGWGYVNLNVGSVQGDCGAGLQAGIIGLVNKGQPRKLDDWGGLSAWGWGASRVLDYLETDSAVDASRVGVQGHSRAGKAALVAMALDERFAIGYISSSGQGGAKLHRRKYGETIENLATRFYYWMGANYLKYTGRWDALPVDSHELIALCAPRPVFISAGNGPALSTPTAPCRSTMHGSIPGEAFSRPSRPGRCIGCSAERIWAHRSFRPSRPPSSAATWASSAHGGAHAQPDVADISDVRGSVLVGAAIGCTIASLTGDQETRGFLRRRKSTLIS